MKIKHNIITGILAQLEDSITERVQSIIDQTTQEAISKGRRVPSLDPEFIRLELVHDLCKAIGKHSLSTDTLVSISSAHGRAGSIVISATVSRDGKEYPFSTDVIYAGGYNIQMLHIRYITRTSLPKVGADMAAAKEIKGIISLYKKLETAENSLRVELKAEERLEAEADLAENASDDDFAQAALEKGMATICTYHWNDLNEYAHEMHGTAEVFEQYQAEELLKAAGRLRDRYSSSASRLKALRKSILKSRAKVEQLREQIAQAS
jgi:hypothetical protein